MTHATIPGTPIYYIKNRDNDTTEGELVTATFLKEHMNEGAKRPVIHIKEPRQYRDNPHAVVSTSREGYFDTPREAWENYQTELAEGLVWAHKEIEKAKAEASRLEGEKERIDALIAAL